MKTILLKLAGPLQSYGTSSYFETRETDSHPSKSAVIGMIAASLGYERYRDEDIRALNALDFAVRVDRGGRLMKDYHTAKKYKPSGDLERTYVTNRYYLEDAVFVAAVGSEDDALVEKITKGLKRPYYQPYLGRRGLPPTWDFYLETVKGEPVDVLKRYPIQDSVARERKTSVPIYADAHLVPEAPSELRNDRAVSFDQRARTFRFRGEAVLEVIPVYKDEHDAFGSI
ncbi:MAG: type I-E CRISPR-associated protein Cas5/CasD [Peptoniphilus sp.]|nr:type I-E CRISPR-associated protein Cas5/CasD [Peptoniphilus sp.]MDD7363429.1 type I-E CRISPR-associated protein Cas5/CasD [Bacillota bacterium]MDY6044431.1 type I-E CRISPR-associated protein Cas5/CasD [Peptoniphilus sp.]